MTTYRWGILGTGQIAGEFAKGLKMVPGAMLHSLYSRTLNTTQTFSQIFGFHNVHESLDDFLNDPDLDIVYIATPNTLHCQQAIQCLDAGKHVLVEKPIAPDVKQAKQIQEAATQNNRFCMEAMWTRFMPVYRKVDTLIKEGAVGDIKCLEASFGFARSYDPASRQFDPNLAGGCLLDLGVYPISLALMLLGTPQHVDGTCVKTESGVDSMAQVTLRYDNGAMANLHCSFDCELPNNVWIGGNKGSIHVDGPIYRPYQYHMQSYRPQGGGKTMFHYGRQDKLHENRTFSKLIHGLRNTLINPLRDVRQAQKVPYLSNGYQYEAEAVMASLDRGQTENEIMTLNDSLAVLDVTDQMRRSWGIVYPGDD